jgi:hypothetical protein
MGQTLLTEEVFTSPNELLRQIRATRLKLHARQMVANLYLQAEIIVRNALHQFGQLYCCSINMA